MTLNFEMQLLQALKDIADSISILTDSVNWLTDEIKQQNGDTGEQQPQS